MSAGSKRVAGRTGPETAKLIRSEIRALCKVPGVFFGCKISVRFRWATHSKAIDVTVEASPINVMSERWVRANAADPHKFQDGVSRYSVHGIALLAACESLMADYNRFDSDLSSDYHNDDFFQHASFHYELERAHTAAIPDPPHAANENACELHPTFCGCADCEAA